MTPNLRAAHQRMGVVAQGLAGKLGAMDAAGVLVGAAVGVLEAEGGPALAAKYLREMADEVERHGPETARN
jgi:hypothetical protein